MENMKRYILIVMKVLCFMFLPGVVSAQSQYAYFKSTTKSLVDYLVKYDTARIHGLFDENKRYEEVKDGIKNDGKMITAIMKKYGAQVLDSISLEKGKNDENVVLITLLNMTDSSLNLKKCELVVFFYPDRFLPYSKKVLNYVLFKTLLKEPEEKFMPLPPDFKQMQH
ncbi:hypothetical protein A3860_09390 [Niastella vici]|uniref:DUF4878 domain-containing protein n=1 Tax=Niastella vici TaxID=1703345 RepID=A0A1V9FHG9_9BACT|nr:hypothetical protein [Niastella vici]OQP57828.1 hypothetical protein A3860_09390 [Niastella vici]